ncbi:Prolyl oligopeptidase family protein [Caulifigura coniformis]|uniref:Prolyl oligopeptidase family protein n=1 Tax=Caulifigura coniformis TaxID=2527983 RepID=A0A517S871_9PLAN|nr:Prolyl oligopeptidase family protein [Caulifigura coniformis]
MQCPAAGAKKVRATERKGTARSSPGHRPQGRLTGRITVLLAVLSIGFLSSAALAEKPNEIDRRTLDQGLAELGSNLEGLPETAKAKTDAAICFKALGWMLRHEEWARKTAVRDALNIIRIGNERIKRLQAGEPAVPLKPGKHVLAYQSAVDESLQPYAVSLPEGWRPGESKRWPLHLVLHGRSNDMNEVSFFASHDGKPPVKDSNWIQLDVYGRGNNAYRWVGETDVFEALADVKKRFLIDERRIALWGFSMGGAGAWHLGLQHPDLWSSVGAGAGFVDFYDYQGISEGLPEIQHTMLKIYDSKDYALNLYNVPVITYGGEFDKQLAASLAMLDAARSVEVPLSLLIGPGMGHKFDDASLKTFMAFLTAHNEKGRPEFPGRRALKFHTYTLKFNKCDWLRIEEQHEPYVDSEINSTYADGMLQVETHNVRALAVARGVADFVSIEVLPKVALAEAAGGQLPDVYFVQEKNGQKENNGWRMLSYDESLAFIDNEHAHKRHGLQGPIDDAFTQPFLIVRGSGTPWNANIDRWAHSERNRVATEWDQWFRGQLRVVDDSALDEKDISSRNLVLFGDPGSNAVIAKVIDNLPLKWTKETITIGGKMYPAGDHVPVLIFPNPLNPSKYVVLNSGPTVKADEYRKSNAWFFPRLGDAAVLKVDASGATPVWSTIMNSDWEIEK